MKKIVEQKGMDFYVDEKGQYKKGRPETPTPYEMAEKVADNLNLHPEYFEDEFAFRDFVEALYEVLMTKADNGEIFYKKKKKEFPKIINNGKLDEIKNNFKRLLK